MIAPVNAPEIIDQPPVIGFIITTKVHIQIIQIKSKESPIIH